MNQTSKTFIRAASLLLAISIFAAPAIAQPEGWTLRAGLLGTDYQKHLMTAFSLGRTELDLDGGIGLEIAAEFRPSRLVGLELSLSRLDVDAELRSISYRLVSSDPFVLREEVAFTSEGDYRIEPVALGLLFHPLRADRFDLYVGPQVAWVRYNVDVEGAGERDAELGFGGKIGAGLRLGEDSPWSMALEFRHLQIPHESGDHDLHTDIGIQTAALVFGYHLGSP